MFIFHIIATCPLLHAARAMSYFVAFYTTCARRLSLFRSKRIRSGLPFCMARARWIARSLHLLSLPHPILYSS